MSGETVGPTSGQSNVIGIALLLGVTVLALGTLTASVGTVVESNAATADAARVATDFDRALAPVESTGAHRGRVSFTSGQLRTAERELRVINESEVIENVSVDALVFTSGSHRVAFLAGAIVRGTGASARMYTPPPITASRSESGGVLVVGAPRLAATSVATSTTSRATIVLRTNVSHRRTALGTDTYRIAVETETPVAWEAYFEQQNATMTELRDFDDDGIDSVVAQFEGRRIAYLVRHDLHLEVGRG